MAEIKSPGSVQRKKIAPDGGFGWICTAGVSMINVSFKYLFIYFFLIMEKFLSIYTRQTLEPVFDFT